MGSFRLIARLDVKGPNLIKGVHLEGLRKIGDPQQYARDYYRQGIDEIIYMDVVASLYGRNNLTDVVRRTAENVFIPITVGGGVRSDEDAGALLRAGADKVAINTGAIRNPELITEIAEKFGSQCVVLSIEAKRQGTAKWEAYTDNGRERSGLDAVAWAIEAERRGAGEILLTSVDCEGTGTGFDLELVETVTSSVGIPVIACGGMGSIDHLTRAIRAGADAVAMAHVLHYRKLTVADMHKAASDAGVAMCEH